MIAIRIPKSQSDNAWRALIEFALVRLVAGDPIVKVEAPTPAREELDSGSFPQGRERVARWDDATGEVGEMTPSRASKDSQTTPV
jgi:hypothetical protein